MQVNIKQGYNASYNIAYNTGGLLDIYTPTSKRVLLLDGEYNPNPDSYNNGYDEETMRFGIMGKIDSIRKILPRTVSEEESKILSEYEQSYSIYKSRQHNMTRKEWSHIAREYERKLSKYRPDNAEWRKVTFLDEAEMSLECFQLILEDSGHPSWIIVSNAFIYEHLPSIGTPKDIHTSEGIIEAWEVCNTTMFYMPLNGMMNDEQISLWRKVLSEILV